MIKSIFLLILLLGFISKSPKTRYLVGISFKQISLSHLWNVKYEDREKWIMYKLSWMPSQKLKPLY